MEDNEILSALAGLGKESKAWKAIMIALERHGRIAMEQAITPDLTDAARHYNAGRASMTIDTKLMLEDLIEDAEMTSV